MRVGEIIIGGFSGTEVPASYERAYARGERGGAIVFKRNLTQDPEQAQSLLKPFLGNLGRPPVLAIDQEGGRVARLGAPFLKLPSARVLAQIADHALLEEIAFAQATELAAVGFTTSFAPVLDVHTSPSNPIIGDRAFGTDPSLAADNALAFARGLKRGGLFACGKHYPGHGDTTKDSHLELPVVSRSKESLLATELVPFARAAAAHVDAFMTAHVVYTELDSVPATLSSAISTDLLRNTLGFKGVLFSDDLEMKALSGPIEELAVRAVLAGCDALLICSDEALQERAREALDREVHSSPVFAHRMKDALIRVRTMTQRFPPRPAPLEPLFTAHAPLQLEIDRRIKELTL